MRKLILYKIFMISRLLKKDKQRKSVNSIINMILQLLHISKRILEPETKSRHLNIASSKREERLHHQTIRFNFFLMNFTMNIEKNKFFHLFN
jgi:hypothetical protein